MMWKPGIRRRLLMTSTLVIVMGLSTLYLLTGRQLDEATLEFYLHDLESEAFVTAGVTQGLLEEEEESDPAMLDAWLVRRQTRDTHQLTLLDAEGRVIASTDDTVPLGLRLYSPEIEAALQSHTEHAIRHTGQAEIAYAAAPVLYEGKLLGVIQVSAPMQPAYEDARDRRLELIVEASVILLISLGVSLWLGQTITRPIKRLHASALRMANGALDERISVTSKDEIGQLGQAFNYMATQVSHLLNTQRSFVSNAAHELRTPLMSVKLRTQSLLTENLPEEQKTTYLQEIDAEVNRLASVVTDLLILARIDEGKHERRLESFDTAAFFHDIVRQANIQARQHQQQFRATLPDSLPDVAIGMNDLRIVLDNLLGNAMKYTPAEGMIILDVTSDTGLHIRVSDTGDGFAPEHQSLIFERFYRVDRPGDRLVAGTGLGLAVVKTIIEHYGGEIHAESPGIGKGATFTVKLPLAAPTTD